MIILNTKRTAHKSNRTIQYFWCYFGLFFDIPSPWETFSNHPFNKMYLGTNWHDTLCDSQVLFENTNNKKHSPNEIWSSAPFLARLICHLGSGILPKGSGPSHKRILYSIAKKMKWIPDSALLLHDNISIKNNFLFFLRTEMHKGAWPSSYGLKHRYFFGRRINLKFHPLKIALVLLDLLLLLKSTRVCYSTWRSSILLFISYDLGESIICV